MRADRTVHRIFMDRNDATLSLLKGAPANTNER
jgi:hypothetical protein